MIAGGAVTFTRRATQIETRWLDGSTTWGARRARARFSTQAQDGIPMHADPRSQIMKHVSTRILLIILILSGSWSFIPSWTSAQEQLRPKWQHAVYTEQIAGDTTYSWQARGRNISVKSRGALMREAGYNVSDKSEPILCMALDFFAGQGWELVQAVHEPDQKLTRYIFRRSVD
jgi:hypothetical protein